MYAAYFGLREQPFAITPDPGYLYLSPHHQEALAHLLYGTQENGGFLQLTGEVGTGKTTLIRTLLAQQMEAIEVALCLNPRLTELEFLAAICDELHIDYPRASQSLKPLVDTLNAHLLAAHADGRRIVLIIDEAQDLSYEVLEQVRLLTNLETYRHKLLRVILVGQPELRQMLARQDLRQLAQRITARYHLMPLDRADTAAYIRHRLRVAGGHESLFTAAALRAAYRWSAGIPRLINVICDRALLGAFVRGKRQVNAATLERAARESLQGTGGAHPRVLGYGMAAGIALVGALAGGYALYAGYGERWSVLFEQVAVKLQPPAAPTAPTAPSTLALATTPVAPAPSPAVALPAPAPVADLARALSADTDEEDAMQRLLALWGEELKIAPGTYPCEQLKNRNLRCLTGQGDWAALRRYNLPAILKLVSADGRSHQVLLRALASDANLDVGARLLRVSLEQLEPLWTGDFLLLWRLPTAQTLIGPGSRGEAVLWLRRQLALAGQQAPPAQPVSDVFDAALEEEVRRFQRSQQLQEDGRVGAQTMLLLNNLAPPAGTPVLSATARDKV